MIQSSLESSAACGVCAWLASPGWREDPTSPVWTQGSWGRCSSRWRWTQSPLPDEGRWARQWLAWLWSIWEGWRACREESHCRQHDLRVCVWESLVSIKSASGLEVGAFGIIDHFSMSYLNQTIYKSTTFTGTSTYFADSVPGPLTLVFLYEYISWKITWSNVFSFFR